MVVLSPFSALIFDRFFGLEVLFFNFFEHVCSRHSLSDLQQIDNPIFKFFWNKWQHSPQSLFFYSQFIPDSLDFDLTFFLVAFHFFLEDEVLVVQIHTLVDHIGNIRMYLVYIFIHLKRSQTFTLLGVLFAKTPPLQRIHWVFVYFLYLEVDLSYFWTSLAVYVIWACRKRGTVAGVWIHWVFCSVQQTDVLVSLLVFILLELEWVFFDLVLKFSDDFNITVNFLILFLVDFSLLPNLHFQSILGSLAFFNQLVHFVEFFVFFLQKRLAFTCFSLFFCQKV